MIDEAKLSILNSIANTGRGNCNDAHFSELQSQGLVKSGKRIYESDSSVSYRVQEDLYELTPEGERERARLQKLLVKKA